MKRTLVLMTAMVLLPSCGSDASSTQGDPSAVASGAAAPVEGSTAIEAPAGEGSTAIEAPAAEGGEVAVEAPAGEGGEVVVEAPAGEGGEVVVEAPAGEGGEVVVEAPAGAATTYRGEVWSDNWSAMYVGTELVMEDSVSITTERSFNEEIFTFEATLPFLMNVVMKDFIENDSGLEYIGAGNQQIGDGGYIAQITDVATGEVVAVSNADWKCLTTHIAPLDKSCERSNDPLTECSWEIGDEPTDWKEESFDDSTWVNATVHPASAVSPKQGYLAVSWDPGAEFIWGADLENHNTILCRVWVN